LGALAPRGSLLKNQTLQQQQQQQQEGLLDLGQALYWPVRREHYPLTQ
jgi:hypothetical protein